MPRLIRHIDKIARESGRDVLFASFEVEVETDKEDLLTLPAPWHFNHEWKTDENRVRLIQWLDEQCIGHEDCGHFASESGFQSYAGNLYIHVPVDENDSQYKSLIDHCELPDGTPRNPRLKLWIVSLQEAMKNAHHDEPGFWERWAETF